MEENKTLPIAIFCSGAGTNAAQIMARFQQHPRLKVALMVCNKKNIGAVEKAASFGVPVHYINKASFYESTELLSVLEEYGVKAIVLAGFLWLIPPYLIEAYEERIINIHPSLLPKYGGKGMYGMNVHQSVVAAKEKESGITIHLVNQEYDKGRILFQASTPLSPAMEAKEVAKAIHQLEYAHFGRVIEEYLSAI